MKLAKDTTFQLDLRDWAKPKMDDNKVAVLHTRRKRNIMRMSLMSKQKGQSPSNPAVASTLLTTAIPTHSSTACKMVISLGREPHPNEFLPSIQKEQEEAKAIPVRSRPLHHQAKPHP